MIPRRSIRYWKRSKYQPRVGLTVFQPEFSPEGAEDPFLDVMQRRGKRCRRPRGFGDA